MLLREIWCEMLDVSLESVCIESEVKEGEEIIGKLDEDLTRLWVVMGHWYESYQKVLDDLTDRYPDDNVQPSEEEIKTLLALKYRAEIARNLFWTSVRASVGLNGLGGIIGVRTDGLVVKVPQEVTVVRFMQL